MIRNFFQRVRSSSTTLTMATGYLAMLSALGVGLFSVPVALRFLSDEEFGLWNIVGQSLGYLLLLDFGVSWSASRMLAGPLASGDSKELNSWWTVIVTILSIQGLLIAGIGLAVTDDVIDFFHLSSGLVPDAKLLWTGMILINAVQMPFRAYSGVLYCQDRWYVVHLISILTSWLNLLAFVGMLALGYRTSAYLVASCLSIGCSCLLGLAVVRRSGLSLRLSLRSFDAEKVRSLFKFSSGIFLLAMAAQLTFMSQSIIIGKVVGVGAVTAFVVSSKSFSVILQLLRRAFEAYSPRWMQIYVGGDKESVLREWRQTMSWIFPVGFIGAMGILIFNRSFSMLYGGPQNHEDRLFDLLLAIGLLTQIFVYSMGCVFPLSTRIKGWCLSGFGDAIVQIGLGIVLARKFGSNGLLLGALMGPALLSIPYLVMKSPGELGASTREMLGGFGSVFILAVSGLAAGFALLSRFSSSAEGWWPTHVELLLGTVLAVGALAWFLKFRGYFNKQRKAEAT